jgi:hypothetical protein
MATLEIGGKSIEVDDSFLSMSAEEQNQIVSEIASQLNLAPDTSFFGEQGAMAQVNKGIAETIGGVVDFINPFDTPAVAEALGMPGLQTGSAATGLENLMESAGINVADIDPEGFGQAFARGVGRGAGAAIPATGVARAVSAVPGVIGAAGKEAYRGLTSATGLLGEASAGGFGAGAGEVARQQGYGETGQAIAEVLGGIGGGILAPAIPRAAPTAVGARIAGRALGRQLAPFTEAGAREVAMERLQGLVGGPERAVELGRQIRPETKIGLSPAAQTGDPNLLALERRAMQEDPLLRERMTARRQASEEIAKGEAAIGGQVEDAQRFLAQRQKEAQDRIQGYVNRATERANAAKPLASMEPSEASSVVASEIRKAEADALAEERALWDAVPKGVAIDDSGSKSLAKSIIKQTPWAQRNDIPEVVYKLRKRKKPQTVAEMHGLYSELRRISRNAMAGDEQNKNRARIANTVAESILEDLGAIDASTDIGRAINTAREFSREMHKVFDRGTVGKLLKRTIDGDERVDPLLTLERSIGAGGTQGLVGAKDIRAAADTSAANDAIEQYLRGQFVDRVFSGDQFSVAKANQFMTKNRELLNELPSVRAAFEDAIAKQEAAGRTVKRADIVDKEISKSSASRFISAQPDEAITSIFKADKPSVAAAQILRQARKDETGAAVEGFKKSFSNYLIDRASVMTPDGKQMRGSQFKELLSSPDVASVARQVYSGSEMNRLKTIAAELQKLDQARLSAGGLDALEDLKPNALVSIGARIIGARVGAQLGGGMAGGLQSAQIMSSRFQRIVSRLTNDKAQQMLMDAVEDPDLFKTLLMDVTVPKNFEKVQRSLAPYISGAAATQAGEEDQAQ